VAGGASTGRPSPIPGGASAFDGPAPSPLSPVLPASPAPSSQASLAQQSCTVLPSGVMQRSPGAHSLSLRQVRWAERGSFGS
jgi:hypothetical protein